MTEHDIEVTGARQLITTRTMAAYRASTCPCGQPIEVGDRIAMIRGKWRCEECNAVSPETTPVQLGRNAAARVAGAGISASQGSRDQLCPAERGGPEMPLSGPESPADASRLVRGTGFGADLEEES